MLEIFFKAVPVYATFYMLLVIMRSILFSIFGNVMLTQCIIQSVEKVMKDYSAVSNTFNNLVIVICIYYGCVLVLNTLIEGVFNRILLAKAEIKVKKVYTELLFQKSIKIDLSCYDDAAFYQELVAGNNESYDRAWNTYRNMVNLCESFVILLSLFIIISRFDFVIFLLALFINVLSALHQIGLNKINGKIYNASMPENKKIDYINRVFFLKQNARDIKITNIGNLLLADLKDSSKRLRNTYDKYGWKKAWITCLDSFIKGVFGDFCTLLYLSYMFFVQHVYSFDVMAALWNAYCTMKGYMNSFVNSVKGLHDNSIYIDKFMHFMEIDHKIVSKKGVTIDESNPIEIEFRNVTFSYDKKISILKNFNLKINANEKIAIVGKNGAGKSTIFKLLLRLYDPDSGEIYVNGFNIKDYDVEFYRKKLCNVLVQNFQQFAATLYENTKLDIVNKENDEFKMNQAYERVGFDKKIKSLSKGGESQYSKEYDDEGVVLSGGEKQKLALARVMIHPGNLVMLDEPSSALDPKSESDFNELVLHSMTQKTLIIISHRLSTTQMVDRIILVENGHVLEDGNHETLMSHHATYAKMFEMQARRYKESSIS